MKYVLVTIRRNTDPGRPSMRYPPRYDAQEVDRNRRGPLVYSGGIGRGEDTEEMMVYLRDAVADAYAAEADARIITEVEADAWLAANPKLARQTEEQVTDPNRLLLIVAKWAYSQLPPELRTEEDAEVLDPDHSKRGVSRRRKTARGLFADAE